MIKFETNITDDGTVWVSYAGNSKLESVTTFEAMVLKIRDLVKSYEAK